MFYKNTSDEWLINVSSLLVNQCWY